MKQCDNQKQIYRTKLYPNPFSDVHSLKKTYLVHKNVFFGVIPINKTITTFDVEPFYGASHLSC